MMRALAAFDVLHEDRLVLARAAAMRSPRERDCGATRRAAAQSMAERLQEGFRLARFADRLRRGAKREYAPDATFAALGTAQVDYVAVGGFAAVAHGVVRATTAVDLVPAPEASNLERLAEALGVLGAHPDGEPSTPVTRELLGRDANMRFQSDAGQIDILGAATYRRLYPELRSRAIEVDVGGLPVVVASRNDLIRLKAGTGRDRDLLDIGDLLALEE